MTREKGASILLAPRPALILFYSIAALPALLVILWLQAFDLARFEIFRLLNSGTDAIAKVAYV